MNTRTMPRWLHPSPDSILADALRQGRPVWSELVHLLWTVWVFVVPLFNPSGYDLRWLLLTLLSYPPFVALYLASILLPKRWVPASGLGMVAMTFALLPWYTSGLSYFVFGCVMFGGGRERRLWSYLGQVLLLNVLLMGYARWLGYPWMALLWMPVTTLVICALIHVDRYNKQRDAALRLSHEEVRRLAATAERERIGRDLHDLLGHTLSLITLKLELSRKLFERDAGASKRELEEAEQIARDALAQVRSAVTGFRAADLAGEIASAHLLLESSRVHLRHAPSPVIPAWIECGLSLVLREAVTNIARHADASEATITVACDADAVLLDISDNGRGGVSANGNGLAGMRERVAALGGSLQIESPRGAGTRLRVRVPLGAGNPVQLQARNRTAPENLHGADPMTLPETLR